LPDWFLVELGAPMIVASTIVPFAILMPFVRRYRDGLQQRLTQFVALESMTELADRRLVGCPFTPRSMPTKLHRDRVIQRFLDRGSDRLNHNCRKQIRNIRSSGIGGRPPCSPTFGYTGSITAASSAHGMIRSMSVRNCARRVVFPYFSNPPSVCCFLEELA
jgi:hypothetical protein